MYKLRVNKTIVSNLYYRENNECKYTKYVLSEIPKAISNKYVLGWRADRQHAICNRCLKSEYEYSTKNCVKK